MNSESIAPCENSTIFDFHDDSSRFEFDHWPETQDYLNELADITFRIRPDQQG